MWETALTIRSNITTKLQIREETIMRKEKNTIKKFSYSELSAFSSQLALILKSGLSSYEGISAVLMKIGFTLNQYSALFIFILVFLLALLFFIATTRQGKKHFHSLCYKLPFLRSLLEDTSSCRFASGLALTLGSGLSNEQGITLVQSVNEDPYFEHKILECMNYINEGMDLSSSLQKSHIFSSTTKRSSLQSCYILLCY